MSLEPHQQRVVTELEELKERTRKLEAFLHTDTCKALPQLEAQLLSEQFRIQVRLEQCLAARIRQWSPESTPSSRFGALA